MMHLLVVTASLHAVDRAEASDDKVDGNGSLLGLTASASATLRFGRTRNNAHDLCVAHLKIARAIGGFLGTDLGVQASELVPAAAIDAQKRHGVSGGIEGHDWTTSNLLSCVRVLKTPGT